MFACHLCLLTYHLDFEFWLFLLFDCLVSLYFLLLYHKNIYERDRDYSK